MLVPDHRHRAADVIPIDRPAPPSSSSPKIIRSFASDSIDTDQLAAVLAKLLES